MRGHDVVHFAYRNVTSAGRPPSGTLTRLPVESRPAVGGAATGGLIGTACSGGVPPDPLATMTTTTARAPTAAATMAARTQARRFTDASY
jgi:hypothetical protein